MYEWITADRLVIEKTIWLGKTKRKLHPISIKMHSFTYEKSGGVSYVVESSGSDLVHPCRQLLAWDIFEAITTCISSYVYVLQEERKKDPSLNFYVEYEGEIGKTELSWIFHFLADSQNNSKA